MLDGLDEREDEPRRPIGKLRKMWRYDRGRILYWLVMALFIALMVYLRWKLDDSNPGPYKHR